jgi:hypothetical protein
MPEFTGVRPSGRTRRHVATPNARFTTTGPGEEGRSYAESGPAMSYAITLATRAMVADKTNDGTWYVRDFDGTCVCRVENINGETRIYALTARVK